MERSPACTKYIDTNGKKVYEQDSSHRTEMNVITVKSASQHFIFVYPSLHVRLTDMIFIRYDSVTSSVSDFKI